MMVHGPQRRGGARIAERSQEAAAVVGETGEVRAQDLDEDDVGHPQQNEWEACFAFNLFSAVRLTHAFLPALKESKAGAIVNLSSTAATMPFPAFAHYCAAKAALDAYSRTLAVDLAPSGIRVSVVSPGPVKTPGGDETRRALSEAMGIGDDVFAKSVPLGRYGSPDDVAEVVALLTSDRGSWMTGGNIFVDGGMTAR